MIGKENIAQEEHFNSDGWVQGDYTQKALNHWSKGIICKCLIKHSKNDPILRHLYKKASNNQHLRICINMTTHDSLFPAISKRSTKWKLRNLIDSQVLTVNSWGTKREPEQSRVTQLGGKTCGGIEARTLMDVESERGVRFLELLKCPNLFFKK